MRIAIPLVTALLASTLTAQVRPTLIEPVRSEGAILIPAAGSIRGASGTFFRSDIQITNLRTDSPQKVQLHWLPGNGSTEAPMRMIEMAPASAIASEDFVTAVMGASGLGSIIVIGVDDQGRPDPLAELHAFARIWTPQPETAGTTSQTFPPVSLRATDEQRLTVLGMRIDERYRANVGIVNADPGTSGSFDIFITGIRLDGTPYSASKTVSLAPFSMVQVSLADVPPLRALQIDAAPQLTTNDPPLLWLMYGSSVDNITGDAWSSIGFPTFEPLEQTVN